MLAQAVQQAFPEAKLGIGPPIKDGFYYDFQVDRPFTPDDLAALEKRILVQAVHDLSLRKVAGNIVRALLLFIGLLVALLAEASVFAPLSQDQLG